MTRQRAHSYSYTGIVILLSREGSGGRLGAGHPLLRPTPRRFELHRDDPRLVGGHGAGDSLEVPDASGVLPEDLRLDLVGELGGPVPLNELIGDLESPKRLDLPLGIAPEGRVGTPHPLVRSEVTQQRPETVGR